MLVVEDEARTRGFLERGLREELFHVESVADATTAELRALDGGFDAILLDVMLPDRDGFAVCRRLRTRGIDTPILLLTGRNGVPDRVNGLNAGADDYLVKPFAFEELIARLRAVMRRGRSHQLDTALSFGSIVLDPQTRRTTVDGRPVVLTTTEFRLLEYLMKHADTPVSRETLGQHVWGADEDGRSNVIDVYISYLRKRLGTAGALIRTIRGFGYTLTSDGPRRV